MKGSYSLSLLLSGLLLSLLALPALGISIVPSLIEAKTPPGSTYTGQFQIFNEKETDVTVEVGITPWAPSEHNPAVDPLTWISLGDTLFTIPAQSKRAFSFEAALPAEAAGERVAMFFFWERASSAQEGISIQTRFGSAFYLAAEGREDMGLKIKDIRLEFSEDAAKPPLLIFTAVNTGKAHLRPRIDVRLSNAAGKQAQLEAPFGYPVFPGQEREYSLPWPDYADWIGLIVDMRIQIIHGGWWGAEERYTLEPKEERCLILPYYDHDKKP